MDDDEDSSLPVCAACNAVNSPHNDICSSCGRILHATSIRVRGGILVVLGLGLVGGMGFLMIWIARVIQHTDDLGATTRFDGSPAAALAIFVILGVVMAFGAISTLLGGWMLRYGFRNERFKRIVVRFAFTFWVICIVIWIAGYFLDYYELE